MSCHVWFVFHVLFGSFFVLPFWRNPQKTKSLWLRRRKFQRWKCQKSHLNTHNHTTSTRHLFQTGGYFGTLIRFVQEWLAELAMSLTLVWMYGLGREWGLCFKILISIFPRIVNGPQKKREVLSQILNTAEIPWLMCCN